MRYLLSYNRDYYAGALMILIGLSAFFGARHYPVGNLSSMGPGYFPAAIGVLLALTGAAIALSARPVREDATSVPAPEWRGWLCIIASMTAFVVLGVYGGLVPATFALVFIAAMGDRKNTPGRATILATAMVIIAVVLFRWALQLQLPLFSWG